MPAHVFLFLEPTCYKFRSIILDLYIHFPYFKHTLLNLSSKSHTFDYHYFNITVHPSYPSLSPTKV